MKVLRVMFIPVEPLSFKWFGSFTWMITGPETRASSEPLPLPSTIIGALINSLAIKEKRVKVIKGVMEPHMLYESLISLLNNLLGGAYSAFVVRGPYIKFKDGSYALHLYPGRLILIEPGNSRLKIIEPKGLIIKGTALKHLERTVVPHLLYSLTLMDYIKLDNKIVEGIAVEILCNGGECRISKEEGIIELPTVRFGGEGRITRIIVEVAKEVLPLHVSNHGYVYVASPILLNDESICRDNDIDNKNEEIAKFIEIIHINRRCRLEIPSKKEVEELVKSLISEEYKERVEDIVKLFRVRIGLIAPGFDTIRGSLREMLPSILPGSILKLSNCERILTISKNPYNNLGWGTLVPLPIK